MARLGIGLIGVGKHGSRYARHIIQDVPALRLVALARRNLELGRQQAAAFDCRAYADYRDLMAAPDVDAVIVVVPPTLHREIIETAAALRRPVLLEKPAAVSVAEGRRMLHAVQEARIPVMVAHTLRYSGVVRAVLEAREQIGRLHSLTVSQHFEPSRPGWIDDPAIAGGGVIMNTGVHSFDLVRLLSGLEAEHVSCEWNSIHTAQTEDNFCALIRLSDGATLASVAGSRATASRSGAIELAGEHGQIIADHLLNTASLVRGTSVTPVPLPPPVATVRAAVADFVLALDRGAPMPISFEEGLHAVAIAEACYRAAGAGRAVPVERI
jgi:predicted dehydrogenase